ncbi:YdcF family protein [Enterococcus olivae]
MGMVDFISFIVPYLLGIALIHWWRKRKEEPELFFYLSGWTLFSLFVYLGIIEAQHGSFYLGIPLCFFLLFLFSYRREKTRLINGLFFNIFLGVSAVYLTFNYFLVQNVITLLLLMILGFIGFFVLLFGTVSLMLLLYWNALIMIRRESRSLANLLTLILAIAMTLWLIYDHFIARMLPEWLSIFLSIIPSTLLYFSLAFLNFLTVSILYQFNQPKYKQDCIIVLGAGLIDGERVTPLLAKRIDKAIKFYQYQLKRIGEPPKLLMSGGQGPDEKISEAVAMKNYALSQGIPHEDILVETNSTTTLENMKFSKEIIQQKLGQQAKVIFASNNYHIFRAGIFARWADLKADGIGARTALYYLPTAFLREFIAIVAMNRKRHFLMIGSLAAFLLLITISTLIFN